VPDKWLESAPGEVGRDYVGTFRTGQACFPKNFLPQFPRKTGVFRRKALKKPPDRTFR
jgi:hypothetical protein